MSESPLDSDDPASPPLVVGIGASAGGLQALRELLTGLPDELDAAFVVVQHLSPDFDTRMDELLARHTRMPVRRVENEMVVESRTVYLLPPKAEMIIAGGRLLLAEREVDSGIWHPIDSFLRSLAQEQGPRGAAVILSGTGSDGSRGVVSVHEAGGLVLAQDPATCRFDGMPNSAIDTGVVDLALPPVSMGTALARYAQRTRRDDVSLLADPPEGVDAIFEILEKDTGVDFASYKSSTIGRRVDRRLLMTGAPDLERYLDLLRESPAEREALYRDLLIGVTSFFRDREAFTVLERDVLPDLIERLPENETLRIWVAACATGEEAYSVAISASEAFRAAGRKPRMRIFATDVHRGSLDHASAGQFDRDCLSELDPERLERYFIPDGSKFRVRESLRGHIVFAYHNLLRDAPFTRLALATCRNLLIYLSPQAQLKALSLFHFGLKRHGVLMLGPSESPGALAEELTPIHRRWKLYRKRRDLRLSPELRGVAPSRPASTPRGHRRVDPLVERVRDALVERFAPPTFVINPDGTLLHTASGASGYLSHPEGSPSLALLDLVSGELKYALAGAIKRVQEPGSTALLRYDNVPAHGPNGPDRLRVTVQRLGTEAEPLLVTFESQPQVAPSPDGREAVSLDELVRERMESLELELRYAKENLQATIEEMEASNEELQATNEELIASNEELHSANEELQSVNEELHTVNSEYQQKITELQQLTTDMEHLLEATDVHTVFLDEDLRIRKFTPKMAETFHLLDRDRGRSIDSFTHRLKHAGLLADLRRVQSTGDLVEREVEDLDGHRHLLRILPYRPRESVEGVVLTLIDVSAIRRAEQRLSLRENELGALLENSPVPIYARDLEGRVFMASPEARRVFDLEAEGLDETDQRVLEQCDAIEYVERIERTPEDLRSFLTVKFPVFGPDGDPVGVAAIARDISERERAANRQAEAVQQRDRFLAMLSHELRNPLAAIANAALLIDERGDLGDSTTAGVLTRQTQHIRDLLEDLLDVSRMTLDRLEIRKKPVQLQLVIQRSLEAVAGLAQSRGIALHPPDDVPRLSLVADPSRLQQMLTNVLSNAVKYTPRGRAVQLKTFLDGDSLHIHVTDEGVGIDPEDCERIFELFYQQEQDLARSGGGLGVGLSLARTIAEGHGGTIRATSSGRGQGCTMEIELPLPSAEEVERAIEAHAEDHVSVEDAGGALTVVIVEDQDDSRHLLEVLVSRRGHTVVGASDGESAVETILREQPDLCLVDIGLPGIDGYEVARRLRERSEGQECFLVALTGYGRPEDRDRAAAVGFDRHLVKPLSRGELRQLLGEAAERRRSFAKPKPPARAEPTDPAGEA